MKIPKYLIGGIKEYYTHRKKSFSEKSKKACLDTISDLSRRAGLSFTAIAGTFWFYNCRKGRRMFNEKNQWIGKQVKKVYDV